VQALHKLVTEHYIKPSTTLSHVSPTDRRLRYEAEERAKILGFPTAKEIRVAKETAAARLKQDEEAQEKIGMVGCLLSSFSEGNVVNCSVVVETGVQGSTKSSSG
jgi:DNA-directed RNA polymerase III subunit RPC3